MLTKALIRRTARHPNVDTWLARYVVRVRFPEALVLQNIRVEGNYVNAVVLCVPCQVQGSRTYNLQVIFWEYSV